MSFQPISSTAPPAARNSIQLSDMIVAVMGITGSGKSTFISHLCGDGLEIGHGLQSCTGEVQLHSCSMGQGQSLHLVDTPGFDDTNKSDTDVLKDIACFLSSTYSQQFRLSGIIYLHRIMDNRMQGTAIKNIRMFQKLCGENCFPHVALVTSMWDLVPEHLGISRETELVGTAGFWGSMVERGSRVFRHNGTCESAVAIVKQLLGTRTRIVLSIQREMVDQQLTLDKTSAGRELESELIKARAQMARELEQIQQDMREAIEERNQEHTQILLQTQEDYERRIKLADSEREAMKINMQRLYEEKEKQFRDSLQEWEREKARHRQELVASRQLIGRLESDIREREKEIEREIEMQAKVTKSIQRQMKQQREEEEKKWRKMQNDLQKKQEEVERLKSATESRELEYNRREFEMEKSSKFTANITAFFTMLGAAAATIALL